MRERAAKQSGRAHEGPKRRNGRAQEEICAELAVAERQRASSTSGGAQNRAAEAAENWGGRDLKHQKRPSLGQAICQVWPGSAEWVEPGERDEEGRAGGTRRGGAEPGDRAEGTRCE